MAFIQKGEVRILFTTMYLNTAKFLICSGTGVRSRFVTGDSHLLRLLQLGYVHFPTSRPVFSHHISLCAPRKVS